MSRSASLAAMIASRIGWTNAASHCEPKPAPPALVLRVIHSLFCRSSAIVIFQGARPRISSFTHCSRFQPSAMSVAGSLLFPLRLRILITESNRKPSSRYLSSQNNALSRMYWRTSGRP
jgi:hypothetical protein